MKKSMLIMVLVLGVLFGTVVYKTVFREVNVDEYTKRDTKMIENFVKCQEYYSKGDDIDVDETKDDMTNVVIKSKKGNIKVNTVISKQYVRELLSNDF